MKVTFLGTSAANAFPEAFCRCKNCEKARLLGGPSFRKRSSILINDDLIIDLGPDIMAASQIHGINLTNVRYCLQTHTHADHLDLSHLLSRSPGFGVIGAPVLNFYASAETLRRAAETFERDLAGISLLSPEVESVLNLKIHQIETFQPFTFGNYHVIAYPANHAPGMGAMLFSVEENHHAIFYATDTAALFEETWQSFHDFHLQFDLVILDHTYGPDQPGGDHLSAHQVFECVQRMHCEGIIKQGGRAFATHIAHEGNPSHPELVGFAAVNDYEVAYDGLTLEV
jgi:phosphoribosyl 1,2-cyclic phosphate phosphodiesterase